MLSIMPQIPDISVGNQMDRFVSVSSDRNIRGVLSIMPNRPVRDQWEYLRKMERHFPIKPGQPIEMALVILNSFTEFPN